MARKAVIETATGKVANVIELEDGADWSPPAGHEVRDAQGFGPGDTFDGVRFHKQPDPPAPSVPAALLSARAKLRALGLTTAEIEALT